MANTNYLKNEVENWVRGWLRIQFPGHSFQSGFLTLPSGGQHEFDAISEDKSIIVGIKSNSYKTSGGNLPNGKFAGLYQELYFLSMVYGKNKLLVLTNEDLYKGFLKNSKGKIAGGIQILFCQLPLEIISLVNIVQKKASIEQKPN
jgi:hypothetical protein